MNSKILFTTVLEEFNKNGYVEYRIPGIIVSNKGTVLCYYEGRMGGGDWTKQDIILKRSVDGGKTFGERKILVQGSGTSTLHNPIFIADGDRIHFIWHKEYNQAFYQRSIDDGLTFSDPVDITSVYEEFRKEYEFNVIAAGPGHGITLENGRILVPVWLANGKEKGRIREHRPSVVSIIYSDDRGDTWNRGEIIFGSEDFINPNETVATELSDHRVLLNIRHESQKMFRAISISTDGAKNFSKPVFDHDLPDPICFGSIQKVGKKQFVFVNCENNGNYPHGSRINLTLKLSEDDCQTWRRSLLIDSYGGYADVGALNETSLCFYEQGVYGEERYYINKLILAAVKIKDI